MRAHSALGECNSLVLMTFKQQSTAPTTFSDNNHDEYMQTPSIEMTKAIHIWADYSGGPVMVNILIRFAPWNQSSVDFEA